MQKADGLQEKGKAEVVTEFDRRNNEVKERIRTKYIRDATNMLMITPFCYSEKISREVAEGIVDHADKLMTNADAEDSDDDQEMNELNNMGDKFQSMQNSIWLLMHVDKSDHPTKVQLLKKLMPQPEHPNYNIKTEKV